MLALVHSQGLVAQLNSIIQSGVRGKSHLLEVLLLYVISSIAYGSHYDVQRQWWAACPELFSTIL